MINVWASLIYLAYFVVFGAIMLLAWGFARNLFLNAFGVSVSVLVLSQAVLRAFGTDVDSWLWSIHIVFLLAIATGLGFRSMRSWPGGLQVNLGAITNLWIPLAIILCFTAYHVVVGPYTEIPSDYWERLGNVTEQLEVIRKGVFPPYQSLDVLMDDKLYVPFLHATVAEQLGMLPLWLTSSATQVLTLCFLLGTYFFALKVGAPIRLTPAMREFAAILTVVLTVLISGVASFSYVRYYAYFPHIINATLLYAVVVLYLDYLSEEEWSTVTLLLLFVFFLTMILINKQEALMALVLIAGLTCWSFLRHFFFHVGSSLVLMKRARSSMTAVSILALLAVCATLWLKEPGPLGAPHLIDLGNYISILEGLLIANPSMRVWDTLGLTGLIVYLWFFFEWRRFQGCDYIFVGMIIPVITVFNPLFVYWFLHVASWDPLWRFSLLVPIALVSANLIVMAISEVRQGQHVVKRVWSGAMIGAFVIAIFPFRVGDFVNLTSRLPSLISVDRFNGAHLYGDLINFLATQESGKRIFTDYVTNYVVTSALDLKGRPSAKASWQLKRSDFDGDYENNFLYYGADDALLIINNRNGKLSWSGKTSKHWAEDILNVSSYSPRDLKKFLDSRPADFSPVWQNDKIFVYEILRNPNHY